MSKTEGIYLTYSRLLDHKRATEWDDWYDTVHLPDIVGSGSAWRATRWRRQGAGTDGWTNANIYEVEGPDIVANQKKASAHAPRWRAEGRHFSDHALMDLKFFEPVGRWTGLADPSPDLTARRYVFSFCADRSFEDEWNEWYDEVHIPDVLALDGFVAATRWKLVTTPPYGANYLALYDVHGDLAAAQENLGKALPTFFENGRIHPKLALAERDWLLPAGRWAGVGYTAGAEAGS